jgi:type II secretory pathway pseudopilin PulG
MKTNPSYPRRPSRRPGFSLIEVTLAIGVVGIAILSLVGILGSTFQQVDDIMNTNRALAGVTRLIGALDKPRTIAYLPAGATAANTKYINQTGTVTPALDPLSDASDFDLAYRLLANAATSTTAVWVYVYDRKLVAAVKDASKGSSALNYNLNANPSVMEVAIAASNNFTPDMLATRNVVGTPMRVRLTLSRLLVGQRYALVASGVNAGEPSSTQWTVGTALPSDPKQYALAYLPIVAEFFPHDFSDSADFKVREENPILVQNIVISR